MGLISKVVEPVVVPVVIRTRVARERRESEGAYDLTSFEVRTDPTTVTGFQGIHAAGHGADPTRCKGGAGSSFLNKAKNAIGGYVVAPYR